MYCCCYLLAYELLGFELLPPYGLAPLAGSLSAILAIEFLWLVVFDYSAFLECLLDIGCILLPED